MTRLLTRQEVSELLAVPAKTLANWGAIGRGPPYVRLNGGHTRYRESDVLAWIEEQPRGGDDGAGKSVREVKGPRADRSHSRA